jgi:hypothetical protein
MPVVSCPKCPTKLQVPDGAKGSVKCPKCGAIFPVTPPAAPAAPAFEVVDQAPKPAPKPAAPPAASKPAAPKAAPQQPETLEPDFEVLDDEKPKKKRVTADEDDDDDEPKSKKKKKSRDDDDDEPKSKKKKSRDDDDDDDEPRNKKKAKKKGKKQRDDDDEDDEDDWSPRDSSFKAAKVGMLMVSISLWLYLGSFALIAILVFLAWLGAVIPDGLMIVPGLIGVGNWVCALVGLGFCIAGPAKTRGLAIAAASAALVHVILVFVVANDKGSGFFSDGTVPFVSAHNRNKADRELQKAYTKAAEKNPDSAETKDLRKQVEERMKERKEEIEEREYDLYIAQYAGGEGLKGATDAELKEVVRKSSGKMRWTDAASLMPFADKFIAVLSYQSKLFGNYVLSLLAGLVEIARLILMLLLVAAVATAARDREAASKAKGLGLIGVCIAVGAAILLTLIVYAIHDSNISSDKKENEKQAEKYRDAAKNSTPKTMEEYKQEAENMKKEAEKREAELESKRAGRKAMVCITELLLLALHGAALFIPALAAMQASSAAGRRA